MNRPDKKARQLIVVSAALILIGAFQNCAPPNLQPSSSLDLESSGNVVAASIDPESGASSYPCSGSRMGRVTLTAGMDLEANGSYTIKAPSGCTKIKQVVFFKKCVFYPSTDGSCTGAPSVVHADDGLCSWVVEPGGPVKMPAEAAPGVFNGLVPGGWTLVNGTQDPSGILSTETNACIRQIQMTEGFDSRLVSPSSQFDGAYAVFQ